MSFSIEKLNKYRFFCETCDTDGLTETTGLQYKWDSDTNPPMKCNNGHSFDPLTIVIEAFTTNNNVTVNDPIGGSYQATTKKMQVTQLGYNEMDIIWPVNMYIWVLEFYATSSMIGDTFNLHLAPNQVIGSITSEIAISNTTINVSPDVFNYIAIGTELLVKNSDGTNLQDFGMITAIDKTNGKVIIEKASTSVYNPGSLVVLGSYPIKNYVIDHEGVYKFGSKGSKTRDVPANTICRIEYTNNSESQAEKTWYFRYECYYS
jgi:hypothetical protein